jgi:amino acid transporter
MEHEERKIAKVYAVIALYTIIMLVVGILLGFAMGKQSVMSEREMQQSDTLQVERVTTKP